MTNNQVQSKIDGTDYSLEPLKGISAIAAAEDAAREEQVRSFIYDVAPSGRLGTRATRLLDSVSGPFIPDTIEGNDWGRSHLDKKISLMSQIEDLDESRAQLQSTGEQLLHGGAKMGVTFGTTFADGVGGTLMGAVNVGKYLITNDDPTWGGAFNAFVSNPFSEWMQEISRQSEQWFPSRYTREEREHEASGEWYKDFFSGNFWGDKFLKNLGFTIGALYAGRVNVGAMSKVAALGRARKALKGASAMAAGETLKSAAGLTGEAAEQLLVKESRSLMKQPMFQQLLGSLTAAAGEGRIEAINGVHDHRELDKAMADDWYETGQRNLVNSVIADSDSDNPYYTVVFNQETGMSEPVLTEAGEAELARRQQILDGAYADRLAMGEAERAAMANRIFALNTMFLTAENLWAFGRFFTGGFKSSKRFIDTAKKGKLGKVLGTDAAEGFFSVNKAPAWQMRARGASVPFTEANEELTQQVFTTGSGNTAFARMEKKLSKNEALMGFYNAKINPDADEANVNAFNGMVRAISEVYGDPAQYEQALIGALTAFLAVPSFVEVRNEDGQVVRDEKGRAKRKFQLSGGLYDAFRDASEYEKQAGSIVDDLNALIQTPEFIARWQSHDRHIEFEKDKAAALAAGDMFEFKNLDFSQLVSDVELFARAGALQDLVDIIDGANVIDENNQEEIDSLKGLFVSKLNGKGAFDEMSNKDFADMVRKHAGEFRDFVTKFGETTQLVESMYGENLDDDIRETLIWQLLTLDDTNARIDGIKKKLAEPLSKLIHDYNVAIAKPGEKLDENPRINDLVDFLEGEKKGYLNKLIDAINSFDPTLTAAEIESNIKALKSNAAAIRAKRTSIEESAKLAGTGVSDIDKATIEAMENTEARYDEAIAKYVSILSAINSGEFEGFTDVRVKETLSDLVDLVKLAYRRKNFIDSYNLLMRNPGAFTKEAVAVRKAVIEQSEFDAANRFIDENAGVGSANDFKAAFLNLSDTVKGKVREELNRRQSGAGEAETRALYNYLKDYDELTELVRGIVAGYEKRINAKRMSEATKRKAQNAMSIVAQIGAMSDSVEDFLRNTESFINMHANNKSLKWEVEDIGKLLIKLSKSNDVAQAAKRAREEANAAEREKKAAEEAEKQEGRAESVEREEAKFQFSENGTIMSETEVDANFTSVFGGVKYTGSLYFVKEQESHAINGDIYYLRFDGVDADGNKISRPILETKVGDMLKRINASDLTKDNIKGALLRGKHGGAAEVQSIQSITIGKDGSIVMAAFVRDSVLLKRNDKEGEVQIIVVKKANVVEPSGGQEQGGPEPKGVPPVAAGAEPVMAFDPIASAAEGGDSLEGKRNRDLLNQARSATASPMGIGVPGDSLYAEAFLEIDTTGLSNSAFSPLDVYGLKEGVAQAYDSRGLNNQGQRLTSFLNEHHSQEFIDSGVLVALDNRARQKNGTPLKIQFAINPKQDINANPFYNEVFLDNGSILSYHNMLMLIEVDADTRAFMEKYFEQRPGFPVDKLDDGILITIGGKSYMPVGIVKDPGHASNEHQDAKANYDTLNALALATASVEGVKDGFVIAKVNGNPVYSNIKNFFAGRTLSYSGDDNVRWQDLASPMDEYRKIYGDKFAFIIGTTKEGNKMTDGLPADAQIQPFPLTSAPAGSLWLVSRAPNGRYYYTYLQVKRVGDPTDPTSTGYNPFNRDDDYANAIRGLLEVISTKDVELSKKIDALTALRDFVHIPYDINWNTSGIDINGTLVSWYNEVDAVRDGKEIAQDVWKVFSDHRLRMQVSLNDLSVNTRDTIINSGVIETDYSSFLRRGANFYVEFISTAGTPVRPVTSLNTKFGFMKEVLEDKVVKLSDRNEFVIRGNSVFQKIGSEEVEVSGHTANLVRFKYVVQQVSLGLSKTPFVQGHTRIAGANMAVYTQSPNILVDGQVFREEDRPEKRVFVQTLDSPIDGKSKLYALVQGERNIAVTFGGNNDGILEQCLEVIDNVTTWEKNRKSDQSAADLIKELVKTEEETEEAVPQGPKEAAGPEVKATEMSAEEAAKGIGDMFKDAGVFFKRPKEPGKKPDTKTLDKNASELSEKNDNCKK